MCGVASSTWELSTPVNHLLPVEDSVLMSLKIHYLPSTVRICCTFPTTNGEHCTGDAIKMAIGEKTIDLKWVQVHPTGSVRQCKHYTGRGVMKPYESGAALAQDMGVGVEDGGLDRGSLSGLLENSFRF